MKTNKPKILEAVYRAAGEAEAQVVRGMLESRGVSCLLQSNAAPSVHAFAINGMGEVKVMVKAAEAEKARKLINGEGYA